MKRLLVLAVVAAAVSAAAPASAEPCELTCLIHRCYAFENPIGTVCT